MQRYLYKIYAEYTLLSQYQANSHTTKHPRNRILRLRGGSVSALPSGATPCRRQACPLWQLPS